MYIKKTFNFPKVFSLIFKILDNYIYKGKVGDKVKEKIDWIKENFRLFIFLFIGLVLGLIITIIFSSAHFRQKDVAPETDLIEELTIGNQEELSFEEVETSLNEIKEEAVSERPKETVVDIKGEVNNPGVYQMEEGSRIIDVIDKAGGVLEEAETTAVNFAQILTDQMVIYVPKKGEELPTDSMITEGQLDNTEAEVTQVDINKAEKEILMTLQGIGPSKAENILSYREENGLFETIEDIKNVPGIGEVTFENLKDVITVTP